MNKRYIKIGASVALALMLALPVQILMEATPIQYAWVIAWLVSFGAVVDEKYSLFTRGVIFLVVSVTLSMLGVAFAKNINSDWVWLVEYIGNIMLLTGSGVGANFIAQHFLDKSRKT